jgi:hypothetical protein
MSKASTPLSPDVRTQTIPIASQHAGCKVNRARLLLPIGHLPPFETAEALFAKLNTLKVRRNAIVGKSASIQSKQA